MSWLPQELHGGVSLLPSQGTHSCRSGHTTRQRSTASSAAQLDAAAAAAAAALAQRTPHSAATATRLQLAGAACTAQRPSRAARCPPRRQSSPAAGGASRGARTLPAQRDKADRRAEVVTAAPPSLLPSKHRARRNKVSVPAPTQRVPLTEQGLRQRPCDGPFCCCCARAGL